MNAYVLFTERLCTVHRRLWGVEVEEDGRSIVGGVKREVQFADVGICVRITLEVVSRKGMVGWTELR
jgi:hypothetical protein